MAERYSDRWKKANGIIPPPKRVNGRHAPEDIAREVLADAPNVEEAIARAEHHRQWGIPKAEKHEPPKRQPTQKALMLARMLLDPNFGRRR